MGENGSVSGLSKPLGKTVHFSVAHLGMDLTSLLRRGCEFSAMAQRSACHAAVDHGPLQFLPAVLLEPSNAAARFAWWKSASDLCADLFAVAMLRIFERWNIGIFSNCVIQDSTCFRDAAGAGWGVAWRGVGWPWPWQDQRSMWSPRNLEIITLRASAALGFVWICDIYICIYIYVYICEVDTSWHDNPVSCRCRSRLKTLSDMCDFCVVSAGRFLRSVVEVLEHLAELAQKKHIFTTDCVSEESHLCKWLSRAASMLKTEWHWRSEHLQLCHSHATRDPPEVPIGWPFNALYRKRRVWSVWFTMNPSAYQLFACLQYQWRPVSMNGMRMTWRRPRILWHYWTLSLIRFVWVDAAALGRTAHFLQQLTFSADCKFFVKKVWRMSPQPVATCTVRCPIV